MDGHPKRQRKRVELCGAGTEVPHGPEDSEAVRGIAAETGVHQQRCSDPGPRQHADRRLTLKQTMDAENVLLEQDKVIDFPLKPSDLSRYDEVLYLAMMDTTKKWTGQTPGLEYDPRSVVNPLH